MALSRFGQANM